MKSSTFRTRIGVTTTWVPAPAERRRVAWLRGALPYEKQVDAARLCTRRSASMIREPLVAGNLYPDSARVMHETISSWWRSTAATSARAVIAPYGSMSETGELCADIFSRVKVPDTVVLLGASVGPADKCSDGPARQPAIASTGRWRLPGHTVAIDTSMAEELRDVGLLREDVELHRDEACLEAQLPFLLHARTDLRIVPVCFGQMSSQACIRIGHALADVITRNGGHAMIVVSASLTRRASDPLPIDLLAELATFDIPALAARLDAPSSDTQDSIEGPLPSSAGLAPTLTALVAAAALGASAVEQVHLGLRSRFGVILR